MALHWVAGAYTVQRHTIRNSFSEGCSFQPEENGDIIYN